MRIKDFISILWKHRKTCLSKIKYVLVVCVSLSLFACAMNSTKEEEKQGETAETNGIFDPDNSCYELLAGQDVFGENYALYHMNDGQLMIFDTISGLSVPYCFYPECQHSRDYIGKDGLGCNSYGYAMNTVSLRNNGSYFYKAPFLYHADQTGYNRKEIVEVKDEVVLSDIVAEYYTKNEVFLSYVIQYEPIRDESNEGGWIAGSPLERREAGLYCINLDDGETSYVYRETELYDAMVVSIHVNNNHVYFVVDGLDVPFSELPIEDPTLYAESLSNHKFWNVYDYSMSTGETYLIEQGQGLKGVCWGDGYYVVTGDYFGGKAIIHNLIEDTIEQLAFQVDACPAFHCNRYLYYQSYDNGETTYGMYDIVEKCILKEIKTSSQLGEWVAAIGNSFYFSGENLWYIEAEDFWNENWNKKVKLR